MAESKKVSDVEIVTNDTHDIGDVSHDVEPSELDTLKARADLLGVGYHPNIGVEKLRDKVNSAMKTTEVVNVEKPKETAVNSRADKRKVANELVRLRITCMNPSKKEWDGEIFTVGNTAVGSITKYVPFNNEEGWHVPRIIYEQIKERQCQIFVTTSDGRGNSSRTGKLIKEFAIEVLPNLTSSELTALAQRQAMSKSIA